LQIVSVVEAMDILSGGAPRFGLSSGDLSCLLVSVMDLLFFIVCWDRIQGKKESPVAAGDSGNKTGSLWLVAQGVQGKGRVC
jgi:hypothetical protein